MPIFHPSYLLRNRRRSPVHPRSTRLDLAAVRRRLCEPCRLASSMTALDRRYDTKIHRRVTRTVMVGDVPIGSEHPVVVQSMINEDTLDIEGPWLGFGL